MAETRKSRPAPRAAKARAPVAARAADKAEESKAAAEFRRFKEAREAAAAADSSATTASPAPASAGSPSPMTGMPPWATPPSFSLPPSAQGWAMLPQPGMVQPAPLAVGPLGDRLGSTLRLGIDVLNMALAGSLRLLGGMGHGGHQQGCGCHPVHDHCGGHDCCCGVEHDDCCTPSVGSCCN